MCINETGDMRGWKRFSRRALGTWDSAYAGYVEGCTTVQYILRCGTGLSTWVWCGVDLDWGDVHTGFAMLYVVAYRCISMGRLCRIEILTAGGWISCLTYSLSKVNRADLIYTSRSSSSVSSTHSTRRQAKTFKSRPYKRPTQHTGPGSRSKVRHRWKQLTATLKIEQPQISCCFGL
jgi:hypothetical protein